MKENYGFFDTLWNGLVKPVLAVAVVTMYIKLLWEVAKWVWNLI